MAPCWGSRSRKLLLHGRKFLGSIIQNHAQTRDCWVGSLNATSVLCRPPPVAKRTQLIMASWKKHRAIHLTATKAQFSISFGLTLPNHVIFYACKHGPRNGNKRGNILSSFGLFISQEKMVYFPKKNKLVFVMGVRPISQSESQEER